MSGFLTRVAALSLLIAVLALPAAGTDATHRTRVWARVAHQVDAAIDHVLALLWTRPTVERAGEPTAICNHILPNGCATSDSEPEGETNAVAGPGLLSQP